MFGLLTFSSISAALAAGFEVYDRLRDGSILVRTKTSSGLFAFALVPTP